MFVDLVGAKVFTFAFLKPIGSVENDFGGVVGEISVGIGMCKIPGDELDGVVKVEANGILSTFGLIGLGLKLFDEVFMGVLCELATFGGVEVDVIGPNLGFFVVEFKTRLDAV